MLQLEWETRGAEKFFVANHQSVFSLVFSLIFSFIEIFWIIKKKLNDIKLFLKKKKKKKVLLAWLYCQAAEDVQLL